MNAYLVRLYEDKQIVGIVVCNHSELFWAVDECCDPGACEYLILGRGGIFWHEQAAKIPVALDEEGELIGDDVDWSQSRLAERWLPAMYAAHSEQGRWRRIINDDPYGS